VAAKRKKIIIQNRMAKTRKSKKMRGRGFLDLFKKFMPTSTLIGGAGRQRKYRGGDARGLADAGPLFGSAAAISNFIDSIPKTDIYYPFLSAFYNKISNTVYGSDIYPNPEGGGDPVALTFAMPIIINTGLWTPSIAPNPLQALYMCVVQYLCYFPELGQKIRGNPPDPQTSDSNYNDLMKLVNLKNQILSMPVPPSTLDINGSTYTKNPNGYYDLNGYYFALMAVTKYQYPIVMPTNYNTSRFWTSFEFNRRNV
jgi:hypothetical protein